MHVLLRHGALLVVLTFLTFNVEVEANADKILNVFLKAIDQLAPKDKVQEIKEKVMQMKPCLEHIAANAGDEAVESYMQSIVPMSVKCKMTAGGASDESAARKKFRACMKIEMDKFVAPLSDKSKAAFEETRACMRKVDGEDD